VSPISLQRIHGEPIKRDELGPGGFDCETSAHETAF
jgi:hypothetical protein